MKVKKKYTLPRLSEEEKAFYQEVLLEEMDLQAWFAVAISEVFDGEEIIINLQ